jgi:hypothetical protein
VLGVSTQPTYPRPSRRRIPIVITSNQTKAVPDSFEQVRFRREGEQLCVDHAPPVMWFARHALEHSRESPDIGLSFDGTHVTLHAPNGRWVWKLTGRSWYRSHGPGTEPLVMVEGIWPD